MIHLVRLVAAILLVALLTAAPARGDIPQRQWLRAETPQAVIYSDGPQFELERWAKKIVWFDQVLAKEYGSRADPRSPPLEIYLLNDGPAVGQLVGTKTIVGLYRQTPEGPFLVANREPGYEKHRISGQQTLFHEYAHHFMYRNFPAAYPAWYREGFAEFVSTVTIDIDRRWTFGETAHFRLAQLQRRRVPIETVLTQEVESVKVKDRPAFYAWAWLLVHMVKQDPVRAGQLEAYLAAFGRGEPRDLAARAFGDLDRLQDDLDAYAKTPLRFRRSRVALPELERVEVEVLRPVQSRIVDLELARRVSGRARDARFELTRLQMNEPDNVELLFALAKAERDLTPGTDGSRAERAVNRVLAVDPDHPGASVLAVQLALRRNEQSGGRAAIDGAALRKRLLPALRANQNDPLALTELFRSYLVERRAPPPSAYGAIDRAFALQPEAARIRVIHAYSLALRGRYEEARATARVLAYDPHRSGLGERALATLDRMQANADARVADDPLPEAMP